MLIELWDYSIMDALKEPFVADETQIVVIPTNQEAVFGGGIAKIIRFGLPELEEIAREARRFGTTDTFSSGRMQTALTNNRNIIIAFIPTKVSWKDSAASLTSVARGFSALVSNIDYDHRIIMPRIGTGLGKLPWTAKEGPNVHDTIKAIADKHERTVIVANGNVDTGKITRGLGVGREVYDFYINGETYDTPTYYGMTFFGMREYVKGQLDYHGDDNPWQVMHDRELITLAHDFRLTSSAVSALHTTRSYLGNAETFWKYTFTDAKYEKDYDSTPRPITVDDFKG